MLLLLSAYVLRCAADLHVDLETSRTHAQSTCVGRRLGATWVMQVGGA